MNSLWVLRRSYFQTEMKINVNKRVTFISISTNSFRLRATFLVPDRDREDHSALHDAMDQWPWQM